MTSLIEFLDPIVDNLTDVLFHVVDREVGGAAEVVMDLCLLTDVRLCWNAYSHG